MSKELLLVASCVPINNFNRDYSNLKHLDQCNGTARLKIVPNEAGNIQDKLKIRK